MKLRTKLFGGFFVVVGIGIFLGVFGMINVSKLADLSEEVLDLADTRSTFSSVLGAHYTWRHSLSETVYAGVPFTLSLDGSTCSLGRWLGSPAAQNITDTETNELMKHLYEPHNLIHFLARDVIEFQSQGNMQGAERLFRDEILPTTQEVINDLGKMQDRYGVLLNEKIQEIHSAATTFQRIIIILIIVALIAGVLLAVIITSMIVKPIAKAADALKVVSEGDLTQTVVVTTKDEIGDLSISLNVTVDKVKGMISVIKEQAKSLSEIGNDLAGNMNKTAVTINNITTNIKKINLFRTLHYIYKDKLGSKNSTIGNNFNTS